MTNIEPVESTSDDERILRIAISEITAIQHQAKLKFALAVGEVVVRRFFGGDVKKMRRRGPKDVAICRLADHPDLPISAASLYLALQVYELFQRLGDLDSNQDLSLTHYRAVLTAPLGIQKQLLGQAVLEAWSVARLRKEVAVVAPPAQPEAPVPRQKRATIVARSATLFLASAISLARLDVAAVSDCLDRAALEQLLAAAREVSRLIGTCLRTHPNRPPPAENPAA